MSSWQCCASRTWRYTLRLELLDRRAGLPAPETRDVDFGKGLGKFIAMAERVRAPIQTYLTAAERAELDRLARELGVSRSEALRRGIETLAGVRYDSPLRELAVKGLVTPSSTGPGEPPPSRPVAPLAELLVELEADRADR